MNKSGHYVTDPSVLSSRFSDEDSIAGVDSIFAETIEEDDFEQIARIKVVMELLPPREADFVDLYFFKKLRQTEIASMFGVSQPTVCYRLSRAFDRIRFLLSLPSVDEEQMKIDVANFLPDPLDYQIVMLMKQTTCQSEVAKILGITQGKVRHRFLKAIVQMRQVASFGPYVAVLDYVFSNLNIMREVQRFDFEDHIITCVDC